jgi:pimeloyl-ACP methyl ester carboxylesterase
MSSAVWGPLWALLPGRRHEGIDLPGHGAARDATWPTDLAGLAAWVADQLAARGCRTLVGLSFGSSVALQVALDRPEVLDRLVLAAPTLSGPVDDPAARAKYLLLARALPLLGPGPALTSLWMADPPAIFVGLRAHPEAEARMRTVIAAHSFAELRSGAMRTITDTVQTIDDLARVRVPTLVIVGDQDMPRFRDNAAVMAEHIPDCRVRTVEAAGHLPLLERPDVCAGLLDEFAPPVCRQPKTAAEASTAEGASATRSSSREWTPSLR